MDIPVSHLYRAIPAGHWSLVAQKVEDAEKAEKAAASREAERPAERMKRSTTTPQHQLTAEDLIKLANTAGTSMIEAMAPASQFIANIQQSGIGRQLAEASKQLSYLQKSSIGQQLAAASKQLSYLQKRATFVRDFERIYEKLAEASKTVPPTRYP